MLVAAARCILSLVELRWIDQKFEKKKEEHPSVKRCYISVRIQSDGKKIFIPLELALVKGGKKAYTA